LRSTISTLSRKYSFDFFEKGFHRKSEATFKTSDFSYSQVSGGRIMMIIGSSIRFLSF
jgi:hypothetical protein